MFSLQMTFLLDISIGYALSAAVLCSSFWFTGDLDGKQELILNERNKKKKQEEEEDVYA